MPLIAEDTLDQRGRPAAGVFHLNIVIELDGQQIHICKMVGQRFIPAAEVGDIAERCGLPKQIVATLDTKAKRRSAIVPHRQRPAMQSRRQFKRRVRSKERTKSASTSSANAIE